MAYSIDHLRTAGKITVYTTLVGILAFVFIFLLNLGNANPGAVNASSNASTSVTVLNTPPSWTATATEAVESSYTNPTDAGQPVQWTAIGTDANGENYYLLICSTNATPTPNSSAAPDCGAGATQWAVSASTTSGTRVTVATTTAASWAQTNQWYAWICDGNAGTPRCNTTYATGTNATNSSPFIVNHRPVFTAFWDDSPADPGAVVTFHSTSSDPDIDNATDTVKLIVCNEPGFSTTTNTCNPGTVLGSTTVPVLSDATATYTVVIPTQDQDYQAIGYVIDNHGFEASGGSQGTDSIMTINNVAPSVASSSIYINGGSDISLVEATQTPNITLTFQTVDNNSCINASSTDEVTGYQLSVYRSGTGISSSTCSTLGQYDPNKCYVSQEPQATWNLSCTASSTSCLGATYKTEDWNCTFPLWYVADPTDGTATTTQYPTDDWRAQVRAIDDNNATGTYAETTHPVNVTSLLAMALNTLQIQYGSLEPGTDTGTLPATSTIAATGNVGIDEDLSGSSMCTSYTASTSCPNSATSTINADQQHFGLTSTTTYAAATALSSTTPQFLDLNVRKSTATSSQQTGSSYWGIAVPGTITFAGSYSGQNLITEVRSSPSQW